MQNIFDLTVSGVQGDVETSASDENYSAQMTGDTFDTDAINEYMPNGRDTMEEMMEAVLCGGRSKNEREDIMVSPNNYEEGTDNMELISKEEFIQYYNMSDEEATKYDIEGFIEEKGITSADLEKTHYDVILKNEAMNGVVYGNNVEQYIHYGYRAATKDDNYVEANYIILLKEVPLEEGLIEKKAVVVDLKKYKIYYDCL